MRRVGWMRKRLVKELRGPMVDAGGAGVVVVGGDVRVRASRWVRARRLARRKRCGLRLLRWRLAKRVRRVR